jgi:hypothetical protein
MMIGIKTEIKTERKNKNKQEKTKKERPITRKKSEMKK